ncbi:MAG: hypothetical protein RIC55_05125 [Pirellulaceae bacterium]
MHLRTFTASLLLASLAIGGRPVAAQTDLSALWAWSQQGLVPPAAPVVYAPPGEEDRLQTESCLQAVGKRVRVEGVGWHPSPDSNQREGPPPESWPRVIFEGGTIYLRGVDFDKADAHGRLVRVVGTLKPHDELNARLEALHERIYGGPACAVELLLREPLPPPPRHYLLEDASLEIVERIASPRLTFQPRPE